VKCCPEGFHDRPHRLFLELGNELSDVSARPQMQSVRASAARPFPQERAARTRGWANGRLPARPASLRRVSPTRDPQLRAIINSLRAIIMRPDPASAPAFLDNLLCFRALSGGDWRLRLPWRHILICADWRSHCGFR
jgi:hypothetical protein